MDEESDAQKPAQVARVAEAVLTTSSAPAPHGMVLTSHDAAGNPRYVPLWAVKHPGIDTSKYGIVGTAVVQIDVNVGLLLCTEHA